jgi:hypothetical protein
VVVWTEIRATTTKKQSKQAQNSIALFKDFITFFYYRELISHLKGNLTLCVKAHKRLTNRFYKSSP